MLIAYGELAIEPRDDYVGHGAHQNQHYQGENTAILDQRRHLLDDQKLDQERNDGNEEPDEQNHFAAHVMVSGIRQTHVRPQDIHREITKTGEHRDQRSPTKIPEGRQQQIGINFLFGIGVELLLQRHIDQIEEVKQPNPGDARDKVQPAQNDVRDFSAAWRLENAVEHSQQKSDMMRRFDKHSFLPN